MSKYNSFEQFINDKFNRLNKYLNIVFNDLEKNDKFLLNYSSLIDYLCQSIKSELEDCGKYKLYDKKSKLTFMDVYNIARDIIESINPKYLRDYDTNKMSININRNFNYRDVIILIHEFFHYTNHSEDNTVNQKLLTEFISIYFETYAVNYLRNIGISDEDINPYDRLDDLSKNYELFKTYSRILTIFNDFGSIDEYCITKYCEKNKNADYYKIINQSIGLLFIMEFIEHDYYDFNIRGYSLEKNLSEMFKDNYKYIIGTIFSFYAIDNVDKESIVLLNDSINTKEVGNMDAFELLNMIGININDDSFIDKVVASIKSFVKSSEKQR